MATITAARERALRESKADRCARHICASLIVLDSGDGWGVDPDGYTLSDWTDGSTVESYSNGILVWER